MRGQLHSCKVIEWEIRFPIPVHVDDVLLASGDVNSSAGGEKKFLSSEFKRIKGGIRNVAWTC